jgi:hypothetical protein
VVRYLGCQGGRGEADAGAQLEDVHRAHDLVEDPDDTARGMQAGSGELEQGGLACPVGAHDHPALALPDLPVDVVDEGLAAPDEAHSRQFQNVAHGPRH